MAYVVTSLGPIDSDKRYSEGDEIPLSPEEAAHLIAAGVVQEVKAEEPVKAKSKP